MGWESGNEADDYSFLVVMYELLTDMRIDPALLELNYRDDELASRIILALPDSKVGVAIEGDTFEPLKEEGWNITELSLADLRAAHRVYGAMKLMSFEHIRRSSEAEMLKNGSKEEGYLLDAILKSGLDEPNRNYSVRRENGTELTVPDFAWVDLKVAFYIDGLYWHSVKDNNEILAQIQESGKNSAEAKSIIEGHKTRAERDMDNRSALTVLGWRILACSDEELHTDEGIAKQIERITQLIRSVTKEKKATRAAIQSMPESTDDSWLDIL